MLLADTDPEDWVIPKPETLNEGVLIVPKLTGAEEVIVTDPDTLGAAAEICPKVGFPPTTPKVIGEFQVRADTP